MKSFLTSTLILLLIVTSMNSNAQTAREIVDKTFSAIDAVQTLEYTFKQKERLKKKGIYKSEVFCKVKEKPKSIYVKIIAPSSDAGKELWYDEGKRGGKVEVNPNGFPYINVTLSPTSSLLMANAHHPMVNAGFGKFKTIMKDAYQRADEQEGFDQVFNLAGSTTFDGQDCFIITITDPTFTTKTYTVKSGENLMDIAARFKIAEYMIMEMNKGVDDFEDVKAGQSLNIPSSYIPKATVYIDKVNYLPIFQKLEDDKGLFEEYGFYGVKL